MTGSGLTATVPPKRDLVVRGAPFLHIHSLAFYGALRSVGNHRACIRHPKSNDPLWHDISGYRASLFSLPLAGMLVGARGLHLPPYSSTQVASFANVREACGALPKHSPSSQVSHFREVTKFGRSRGVELSFEPEKLLECSPCQIWTFEKFYDLPPLGFEPPGPRQTAG